MKATSVLHLPLCALTVFMVYFVVFVLELFYGAYQTPQVTKACSRDAERQFLSRSWCRMTTLLFSEEDIQVLAGLDNFDSESELFAQIFELRGFYIEYKWVSAFSRVVVMNVPLFTYLHRGGNLSIQASEFGN